MNAKKFSRQKPPTIKDVLADENFCACFRSYLDECVCVENLLFYERAENYRKIKDPAERRNEFNKIVNDFMVSGAKHEMHIGDSRHREIQSRSADPQPDSLLEIQADVWTVLRNECMPRFVKSETFYSYLENQPDSPRTARSRKKLEEFFGEELKGDLTRIELVNIIRVQAYEKNEKIRKLQKIKYADNAESFACNKSTNKAY